MALTFNYHASIALPLRIYGSVVGAINLYSQNEDAFDEAEISLLEDMAGEIGAGIGRLLAQQKQDENEAALHEAQTIAPPWPLPLLPESRLLGKLALA
jgi:GAF domain-containing protein